MLLLVGRVYWRGPGPRARRAAARAGQAFHSGVGVLHGPAGWFVYSWINGSGRRLRLCWVRSGVPDGPGGTTATHSATTRRWLPSDVHCSGYESEPYSSQL